MFKKIDILIIFFNIIFFLYYSSQLLVFTNEFALLNFGFYNHAIAGLSEILGIIFLTFVFGLIIILFRKIYKQLPFFISIFIFQLVTSINFWRYVMTNSPGEANIAIISYNTYFFSFITLSTALLIFRNYKKL